MAKLTVLNSCCGTRLRRDGCHGPLVLASAETDEACCCCSVQGIYLDYTADHCCNAAVFDVYIQAQGGNRVKIGQINMNGCGLVPANRITITAEQAAQISAGAQSCCLFDVDLDCAQPAGVDGGWGAGNCHPDLAGLTVTAADGTVLFSGFVGENPAAIDACENA